MIKIFQQKTRLNADQIHFQTGTPTSKAAQSFCKPRPVSPTTCLIKCAACKSFIHHGEGTRGETDDPRVPQHHPAIGKLRNEGWLLFLFPLLFTGSPLSSAAGARLHARQPSLLSLQSQSSLQILLRIFGMSFWENCSGFPCARHLEYCEGAGAICQKHSRHENYPKFKKKKKMA